MDGVLFIPRIALWIIHFSLSLPQNTGHIYGAAVFTAAVVAKLATKLYQVLLLAVLKEMTDLCNSLEVIWFRLPHIKIQRNDKIL